MTTTPKYIQDTLDRLFPGVSLDHNLRTGCWVLSDYLHWPNGNRCHTKFAITSVPLRGVEGGVLCQRTTIFEFKDELGRFEPSLDKIINVLRQIYLGGRHEAVDAFIDQLEAQEDEEELQAQLEVQEAANVAKKAAWTQGVRGRVISTPEGYVDNRKLEKDYQRQYAEDHREEQLADADEAVTEALRRGAVQMPGRGERKYRG